MHYVVMITLFYIFGGQTNNNVYFNDLWSINFNDINDKYLVYWKQIKMKKSIPQSRSYCPINYYKKCLYLIGGLTKYSSRNSYHINDIDCFDLELKHWSRLNPNNIPSIAYHTSKIYNKYVVIM